MNNISGLASANIRMGLLSAAALPFPTIANWDAANHIGIRKQVGTTNWESTYRTVSSVTASLGQAPLEDQWRKFRIEYYGPDYISAAGSTTRIVMYINDVEVADIQNAAIPSAIHTTHMGYPVFIIEQSGAASTTELIVGPVKVRYVQNRS
jgi:hypothetical protein